MTDAALQFSSQDRIGRVAAVDTSRLSIDVDDPGLMTTLSVGNLVAIRGLTVQEFLIGIVERATRSVREELLTEDADEQGNIPVGEAQVDVIRVVLIGTFRTIDGSVSNVFKRGADSFPQIDRECFLISSGNLQRFMNLLSANVEEGERLQLGKYLSDANAVAVANGDRFFQRHAAVLGSTGSGKSWCIALILERASKLAHPNLIVLDMHGEYSPIANEDFGYAAQFRIAGPGDLDARSNQTVFLPYWLLNREEMLAMILDRSDQNAPNQASRFTHHVRELKERTLEAEGKEDVRKTFTVDSPIFYSLNELMARLRADDVGTKPGATGKPIKGDWNGKLTRFIARLSAKVEDRRYGFMFSPPNDSSRYEWLGEQVVQLLGSPNNQRGIKVVDFSEVPSDVLPVVASVLARLLYDAQFWIDKDSRTPICFVCDEAHLYLPVKADAQAVERRALETFERIAKEGRKYGVALVVVSQRPSDVSRTILSQCNNFLVLRLTNDQDQSVVTRLMPDSMSSFTEMLPLLETGEALLLGDSVLLPTRIRLDVPKLKPESATRDFWTEWRERTPQEAAIKEAIETLRRQSRTAQDDAESRMVEQ